MDPDELVQLLVQVPRDDPSKAGGVAAAEKAAIDGAQVVNASCESMGMDALSGTTLPVVCYVPESSGKPYIAAAAACDVIDTVELAADQDSDTEPEQNDAEPNPEAAIGDHPEGTSNDEQLSEDDVPVPLSATEESPGANSGDCCAGSVEEAVDEGPRPKQLARKSSGTDASASKSVAATGEDSTVPIWTREPRTMRRASRRSNRRSDGAHQSTESAGQREDNASEERTHTAAGSDGVVYKELLEVVNKDFSDVTFKIYAGGRSFFDKPLITATVISGARKLIVVPSPSQDAAKTSEKKTATDALLEVEVHGVVGKTYCNARRGQKITYEGRV